MLVKECSNFVQVLVQVDLQLVEHDLGERRGIDVVTLRVDTIDINTKTHTAVRS